jgi:AraC family transcriptional regulator
MVGTANLQVWKSTYIAPGHTFRSAGKSSVNSFNAQKLHLRQAPISDLSDVYPDAVVASSQALGWQNLRAMEVHQDSIEWSLPPLENHCVIIQTGPPLQLSAIIDGRSFDQRIQTGEIIVIPAGVASHWRLNDVTSNYALHLYLSPNFVRTTASSFDLDQGQISIEPQFGVNDEHIQHIGMSLLHELKQSNILGRFSADALANVLAMQLVRRYSYLRDVQTSRGGVAPRKLRRAIEFINVNLEKEQTVALAAVAEEVGMSYFHFSRAFKQSMGVSPNVYMIEQRIERAKKLLSETDVPIAEIALRVGFASQSHFTTTFRRLAWTTPKAFREML